MLSAKILRNTDNHHHRPSCQIVTTAFRYCAQAGIISKISASMRLHAMTTRRAQGRDASNCKNFGGFPSSRRGSHYLLHQVYNYNGLWQTNRQMASKHSLLSEGIFRTEHCKFATKSTLHNPHATSWHGCVCKGCT